MILEIGKCGPIGPLTFRKMGPSAHLGVNRSDAELEEIGGK